MTRPRFHYGVCVLIALAAMWGPGFVAHAEQSPTASPLPAEAKSPPPPRAKPQVIYHLPRSSRYAATLHSQAKNQSHPLPIDSNMPPSLQISRAAANEAAAKAQREQQQQQSAPRVKTSRQQRVNRPKFHSRHPQLRKHGPGKGPGKGRGPGSSRGKSGKR